MSFKEFFLKQAVKFGAKDLPEDRKQMLMSAVEKNPELFNKIAKEIEALKKAGKPEMYAALDVMKKYQKELQAALQK